MNNLLNDFEPVDIIAIIIIILGLFFYYLKGNDSLIELVYLISGFYFGRKHISRKRADMSK